MTYKATILVALALVGVLVFAGCTDAPAEDTDEGEDFPDDGSGNDDQNQTASTAGTYGSSIEDDRKLS